MCMRAHLAHVAIELVDHSPNFLDSPRIHQLAILGQNYTKIESISSSFLPIFWNCVVPECRTRSRSHLLCKRYLMMSVKEEHLLISDPENATDNCLFKY